MKSRDAMLRSKRFDADEKARKVADLECMIREFEQMAVDLDRQIQAEEERTGIRDATHFAYSTFAKAAALRRDNLRASAAELQLQLDAAVKARDLAIADLDKSAKQDSLEIERGRRKPERASGLPMR
jgi:hypothetical protein